jgi:cell division protein FtsQ
MDRSLAGRRGIGALTARPARASRAARRAPRGARARSRPPASTRKATRLDDLLAVLWRLPAGLAALLGACRSFLGVHRRLRVAVLVTLALSALLGGGWLWLRHSSLVAVRDVRIGGVRGVDASAIDSALTAAARRMSTLDVQTAQLRAAVAAYPVVADVRVSTSFPHGMQIRVIEQRPVAAVVADGVKTAVAADGVVLGSAHLSGSLPTLAASAPLPAGEHVHSAVLLGALSVLGAAPPALAKDAERAYDGREGLTVALSGGVLAYFGDATRSHAKWLALARVLADPSSAGAAYVDVRLPERPAAGFAAGVAPPPIAGETATEGERSGPAGLGAESTEALAEGLAAAVGGGSSASASSEPAETSSGESEPRREAESSVTGNGEASGAEGSEGHG